MKNMAISPGETMRTAGSLILATVISICAASVSAQDDRFKDVVVTPTKIADSIYIVTGGGGNIGVSAGADGLLIIDDQYAPLADRIAKALEDIGETESIDGSIVKYVVNTHYHRDHTDNNGFFGRAGSTIVAHENVRVRLLSDDAIPKVALPVITHKDGMRLYFNGDVLDVDARSGHTDGDSSVYFEKANVLHTGDLLFNGLFPYIDVDGGGSVADYIEHQAELLEKINADTVVIPGHGPLGDKSDLDKMHAMIKATLAAVETAVAAGASLDDILAAGVAPEYKQYSWAFISEERWLTTLHATVTGG